MSKYQNAEFDDGKSSSWSPTSNHKLGPHIRSPRSAAEKDGFKVEFENVQRKPFNNNMHRTSQGSDGSRKLSELPQFSGKLGISQAPTQMKSPTANADRVLVRYDDEESYEHVEHEVKLRSPDKRSASSQHMNHVNKDSAPTLITTAAPSPPKPGSLKVTISTSSSSSAPVSAASSPIKYVSSTDASFPPSPPKSGSGSLKVTISTSASASSSAASSPRFPGPAPSPSQRVGGFFIESPAPSPSTRHPPPPPPHQSDEVQWTQESLASKWDQYRTGAGAGNNGSGSGSGSGPQRGEQGRRGRGDRNRAGDRRHTASTSGSGSPSLGSGPLAVDTDADPVSGLSSPMKSPLLISPEAKKGLMSIVLSNAHSSTGAGAGAGTRGRTQTQTQTQTHRVRVGAGVGVGVGASSGKGSETAGGDGDGEGEGGARIVGASVPL